MPSQNEPHSIQGWSLSSTTRQGSMAFQLSRLSRDATMQPLSLHTLPCSERVQSSPMADVFLPNVEQL